MNKYLGVGQGPKSEEVPRNSQLIVFMDEPTAFLDYDNKYKFRDKINDLLKEFSPRLQFFIATNDPILIEKTPGCRYINLYQKPAGSSLDVSLR